jgi:hypothetical protein
MGNELTRTRKNELIKQKTGASTEADMAVHSIAEQMLFGAEPTQSVGGPPSIMLILDCTISMGEWLPERPITPEMARTMADAMFAKGGAGLRVKLAYFRGDGEEGVSKKPRQLHALDWYETPEDLARAIAGIEHWHGWSQICGALRYAADVAKKEPVHEVVIVSDAFETKNKRRPLGDDLQAARVQAERLRALGATLSFAYPGTIVGGCPLDRAGIRVEEAFRSIAEANGGAAFVFNAKTIADRLGSLAGQAALAAKGDTAGAQLQLEHFQSIPFTVEANVVGAQVPRCATTEVEED